MFTAKEWMGIMKPIVLPAVIIGFFFPKFIFPLLGIFVIVLVTLVAKS